MPVRDLPDWGQLSVQQTVYPITDPGELAARLGSIVTFDRRGDVLWLDDFEHGLTKWETDPEGAGASIELSLNQARNDGFSVLLTAGSDSTRLARITHYQPYPVLSNLGFEFSFSFPTSIESLYLALYIYDGTNCAWFQVLLDDTTNELSYLDSSGNWVSFATGVGLYKESRLFNTAKLVVDALSDNYLRFILNSNTYSLSAIPSRVTASALLSHMRAQIQLNGRAGQNDQAYIDDVILTQNEPS